MNITVVSKKGIDQVGEDLQKAITDRKFGVVGILDMKATMAKKGVDFGPACRIYEVCQPEYAKAVLTENMEISTALPCRISVYEKQDEVVLSTMNPSMMVDMFGAENLTEIVKKVESVLVESMEEAAS